MRTGAFEVDLRRHVGREEIVRLVMSQHRWSPEQGDPYAYLCDCLSDTADHAQLHAMTLVRALGALPLVVLRRWVRAVLGRAGGDREALVFSLVAAYAALHEVDVGREPNDGPWWHDVARRVSLRVRRPAPR
jgi:hypothetical protein